MLIGRTLQPLAPALAFPVLLGISGLRVRVLDSASPDMTHLLRRGDQNCRQLLSERSCQAVPFWPKSSTNGRPWHVPKTRTDGRCDSRSDVPYRWHYTYIRRPFARHSKKVNTALFGTIRFDRVKRHKMFNVTMIHVAEKVSLFCQLRALFAYGRRESISLPLHPPAGPIG
jgi:hypothetical protein